jgi:nucleoid DNA-binding protein
MATHRELTATTAQAVGLPIGKTDAAVQTYFEQLTRAVDSQGEVRIPGVGTFVVATHKARKGRNIHTGVAIDVPERRVMRFRPAKAVRDRLNP